ncbi:metallopeptidase [Vreelandella sulfidaeris]|uniref:Metallopeptidase n=1 Tax=Vreelandella sulfidaeris TaxID=115553 RepID=A0A365TQA6_9GAMM|nr:SprT-like domain-containing protein [Halomonas sulfidaeris]RBI68074.1 metallopeptidase [Halomonas sulfidaeris]
MKTLPLPSWPAAELAAMSETELHRAVRVRVEQALQRCREVCPSLPAPTVCFNLRGASAGQAHLGRGGLRFNPVLLSENRTAFFEEIIPHEMAHWLVFHLHNGARLKPHGREWQTVMRDLFGLAPNVTHQFDIQKAQSAPYRYQCDCQFHRFTARRHTLVANGRRYRCRYCAKTLVYRPEVAS